jgi:hypothetical protein
MPAPKKSTAQTTEQCFPNNPAMPIKRQQFAFGGFLIG